MANTDMISTRFSGADWFSINGESEHVIVGGAGGIGSWLVLLLARAGFQPTVYDFDIIETHNIGGQFYTLSQREDFKTSALADNVKMFSEKDINTFNKRFDKESMGHVFMLSAFDNMQARRDMFHVWKKQIEGASVPPIFIDGRLEMEQMQIYCVTADRIEDYEKTLFDDNEVIPGNCTEQQTSHFACGIAFFMVTYLTNHISNIYNKMKERKIPFYKEFFGPLDITITEL